MTQDEASRLLLWLGESARLLTDAGYPAEVHNKLGAIGLVVKTQQGLREWTFFITMVSPAHVVREIRARASVLGIVLPDRAQ
jgi:hypothetical protein